MKDIYEFMDGRDVSASFSDPAHDSKYSFGELLAVDAEAKRVVAKIKALAVQNIDPITTLSQAKGLVTTELDKNLMFTNELDGNTWVQYKNSFVTE